MKLNLMEQRILDFLDIGENQIAQIKIAEILKISRPTIQKYIRRLQEKGLIKKSIIPNKSGTTGDPTKLTIIIKL